MLYIVLNVSEFPRSVFFKPQHSADSNFYVTSNLGFAHLVSFFKISSSYVEGEGDIITRSRLVTSVSVKYDMCTRVSWNAVIFFIIHF